MVGLTLGLAAAQGGLNVAVVDALAPETVLDAEFDGRVSALAYASVRMLTALGVWPHLEAARPAHPRDSGHRRQARPAGLAFLAAFRFAEVGAQRWAISPRTGISAPRFMPPCRPESHLIAPAAVTRLENTPGGMSSPISAMATASRRALAVAADGRDSKLRAAHGHRRDRLVLSADRHRRHRGA